MKPKKTNSIVKVKILEDKKDEILSKAMPEFEERFSGLIARPGKLELETPVNGVRRQARKTISEDYRALEESINRDDIIEHATVDSRLKAGCIDVVLCAILGLVILKYIPKESFLTFSPIFSVKIVRFLAGYWIANLIVCVLPMMFFSRTLGLKIQKLKIRSKKQFKINIVQAFLREAILKIVLSFSFFKLNDLNYKDEKTLYDQFSRTIVIVD